MSESTWIFFFFFFFFFLRNTSVWIIIYIFLHVSNFLQIIIFRYKLTTNSTYIYLSFPGWGFHPSIHPSIHPSHHQSFSCLFCGSLTKFSQCFSSWEWAKERLCKSLVLWFRVFLPSVKIGIGGVLVSVCLLCRGREREGDKRGEERVRSLVPLVLPYPTLPTLRLLSFLPSPLSVLPTLTLSHSLFLSPSLPFLSILLVYLPCCLCFCFSLCLPFDFHILLRL